MSGLDLEVRILAAMTLLRMARAAKDPERILHFLNSSRVEIAGAVELLVAGVKEQALLQVQPDLGSANGNGGT